MSHSYICRTCGVEHDTIPKAMACFDAHEAAFQEAESVTLEPDSNAVPDPLAAELLGRAARHMHDRAQTYDEVGGERSMGKAVTAFNAITGQNLTEAQGWLMMVLLKAVRGFAREQYHADSFEDLIAYGALCAEARSKGQ